MDSPDSCDSAAAAPLNPRDDSASSIRRTTSPVPTVTAGADVGRATGRCEKPVRTPFELISALQVIPSLCHASIAANGAQKTRETASVGAFALRGTSRADHDVISKLVNVLRYSALVDLESSLIRRLKIARAGVH